MVDESKTRRRVRQHSAAKEMERESHDYDYRSDDDDDQERIRYSKPTKKGQYNTKNNDTHTKSGHRNKQHTSKRKRRRKKKKTKEPPFFILFCQVGLVLFLLCYSSLYVYRGIYGYLRSNDDPGEDDVYEYEYVGDSISHNEKELESIDSASQDEETKQQEQQTKKLQLKDLLKQQQQQQQQHASKDEDKSPIEKPTMPPLPNFDLSKASEWDAFGILETISKGKDNNQEPIGTTQKNNNSNDNQAFWQLAQTLRANFSATYGGENAGRMLLDRGLGSYGNDQQPQVQTTACRFHRAKMQNRSIYMAFGGYSVTAGRGNLHTDSYPHQLQLLLEPLLQATNLTLQVTNAAIGGVPSFPYGWCMKEFWGHSKTDNGNDSQSQLSATPDVVSWDFGMNEATGSPEGLESYIRQLLATYGSSMIPKLVVKDSFAARDRRKLVLDEYSVILKDPLVLHTDHAVESMFQATTADHEQDFKRPLGFQKWREWGAPKGAPGQAPHHPAKQEHKLDAWILAMHFLASLEYMVAMEEKGVESSQDWCPTTPKDSSLVLPPPVWRKITNDTTNTLPYEPIFFGAPMKQTNINYDSNDTPSSQELWRMNSIHCRTTFEPKVSGDLSELVVNGTVAEDLNVILPKSQQYYNRGWTYDLSTAERAAKRKLNLYPKGLGFVDSKEAYFGIYESKAMTLFLPYQARSSNVNSKSLVPQIGDTANDWFESIVLCQVNDKNTLDSAFSDPNSCQFGRDVGIRIGGVEIPQNATKMFSNIGSLYLGKPICKHVPIPSTAKLTSHNTLLQDGNDRKGMIRGTPFDDIRSKLLETDEIGLLVQVYVANPHIVHVNQACSLSHVVWEERHSRRGDLQKDQAEKAIL